MGEIEERFRKAGLKVTKLESAEEIKNNNWVLPTTDKEGMIKFRTKWFSVAIQRLLGR